VDFSSSELSELALMYKLAGQDSNTAVVTDRDGFATDIRQQYPYTHVKVRVVKMTFVRHLEVIQ